MRHRIAFLILVALTLAPTLALAQGSPLTALLPSWLVTNWPTVATVLGVWAFVASILNRTLWPKPAKPTWLVVLHYLLIDGIAVLPSINFKGIFGLPVNVPLYPSQPDNSNSTPSPPSPPITRVASILLLCSLGLSACGHTSAEVIAINATTVTVKSVDEGIHLYARQAAGIDNRLAAKAIADCASLATHADRQACQGASYAAQRKPYDAVDKGIKVYREILAADSSATQGDILAATANLAAAFDGIGIHVLGGTP
jgi:hypothetical protein